MQQDPQQQDTRYTNQSSNTQTHRYTETQKQQQDPQYTDPCSNTPIHRYNMCDIHYIPHAQVVNEVGENGGGSRGGSSGGGGRGGGHGHGKRGGRDTGPVGSSTGDPMGLEEVHEYLRQLTMVRCGVAGNGDCFFSANAVDINAITPEEAIRAGGDAHAIVRELACVCVMRRCAFFGGQNKHVDMYQAQKNTVLKNTATATIHVNNT